jgi:hypothetical protein
LFGRDYVYLDAGEAAAYDFAGFEARSHVERFGDGGQLVERDARVNQGAEEHVTADTGEAIKIGNTHRL